MSIWTWLLEYPQVLAALVTFALAVLLQISIRVFAARPRLRWGQTSDTIFLVPIQQLPATTAKEVPTGAVAAPAGSQDASSQPQTQLPAPPTSGIQALPPNNAFRARTIWLVNSGSAAAEDVEIAFNWPPEHLEWYPHLPTVITKQPDGRHILSISRLNPKEGITFSLLSMNQEHPDLMHVRCKGFQGKQIRFWNQQVFPWWVNALVAVLMLLGCFTVVSWVVQLLLSWAGLTPPALP